MLQRPSNCGPKYEASHDPRKEDRAEMMMLLHDDINAAVAKHVNEWQQKGVPDVDIQGATMEALARSSARLVAFYASCTDAPQEALESLSRLLVQEVTERANELLRILNEP
jgi:hypothetical protein